MLLYVLCFIWFYSGCWLQQPAEDLLLSRRYWEVCVWALVWGCQVPSRRGLLPQFLPTSLVLLRVTSTRLEAAVLCCCGGKLCLFEYVIFLTACRNPLSFETTCFEVRQQHKRAAAIEFYLYLQAQLPYELRKCLEICQVVKAFGLKAIVFCLSAV